MFTGWPSENNIMNQGSMQWADAGCLRPADDEHSQDDLQLLLESPTALAAQYNYFSAHLSGDLGCNQDPLRQNSLVGSPDFSRQLNMAGLFDAAADAEQHHTQPHLLSLQLAGSFQPDSLLLPPSQEPQQASTNVPASHVAAAVAPAAAPYQNPESQQTYDVYQILQQRQQQRYAVQNALHNHQRAPSMGWMVQLPAASTFHLPGIAMPQQPMQTAAGEAPMLQVDSGLHAHQQQQQVASPVQMPAVEDLPVSSAPRKKRALASLAGVLRPVAVPVFGVPPPKVPVITYAKAADEKQAEQGTEQQQQQQQQPLQLAVKEAQQQQQPQAMNLRRRPKQQHSQQQLQKQPVKMQPGKQQPQPTGTAAAASPAQQAADAVPGMLSGPVSGAPSSSTAAAQARASQATTSTSAPGGSSAAGLGKGALVWAKFPRFPWWPAIIMSDAAAAATGVHSTSSSGTSTASGASTLVLVRFLGTYDATWAEPKAVSRWGVSQHERASKTKAAAFMKALQEAACYLDTGELPEEFQEPPQLTQAPPPAGKHKKSKQIPAEATPTATAAELLHQQPDVWSLVPQAAPAAASSSPGVPHAQQPTAAAAAAALLQRQLLQVDGDSDAGSQGHVCSASAAHSSNTSSSGGSKPAAATKPVGVAKRKVEWPASKNKRSKTGR